MNLKLESDTTRRLNMGGEPHFDKSYISSLFAPEVSWQLSLFNLNCDLLQNQTKGPSRSLRRNSYQMSKAYLINCKPRIRFELDCNCEVRVMVLGFLSTVLIRAWNFSKRLSTNFASVCHSRRMRNFAPTGWPHFAHFYGDSFLS